jgi:DNA-binding beta-propeller fold protein YncE
MTSIEDRLRAATRAAAGTVAPGTAPPLHLPDRKQRRGSLQPLRRRRWPGWMAPLAAAASVAAVLAGTLAVTSLFHGHQPARPAVPGTVPLHRAPPFAHGPVPPYAVTLLPGRLWANPGTHAEVVATATGAVLATVRPPAPYANFTWVTAAGDDRSFVLAAHSQVPPPGSVPETAGTTRFFVLRLDPPAGTARLSALPIAPIEDVPRLGDTITGVALSPDGSKLAVASGPVGGRSVIQVFSTATGSARAWTAAGRSYISADRLGANPLSWTADGRTLAFDAQTGLNIEVRLLDTGAPGENLWASPRVVTFANWPDGSVAGSAMITPDGARIVAMAVPADRAGATQIRVNEFSVSTGKLTGVLEVLHYRKGEITGWPDVEWTDSSGSTLIVSATRPRAWPAPNGGLTARVDGVVSQGRFTILPGIPGDPAW